MNYPKGVEQKRYNGLKIGQSKRITWLYIWVIAECMNNLKHI